MFMAGVVNAGTSPRPRARYNSWIDAGRTPACCPISQISQRASSRSPAAPNTARRTSSSIAALWRTAGLWNRRSTASGEAFDMRPPSCRRIYPLHWPRAQARGDGKVALPRAQARGDGKFALLRAHFDNQSVVGRRDGGREPRGELGVRAVVRQVREEGLARADLLRDRDG